MDGYSIISILIATAIAFVILWGALFLVDTYYPIPESFPTYSIGEISCGVPDFNCPACECKASCTASTKLKYVEGCHLPERYFSRPSKEYEYTGYSNIPSIFMGNKIVGVKVESERDLHVGCFYGFIHKEQFKVHRLIGVYSEYLKFRGDNSEGTEKVQFEDLKMLIREVKFK